MRRLIALLACFAALLSFSACQKHTETDAIQFKHLTWAVGVSLPTAEEFAVSVPKGTTLRYATDYAYTALGEYRIKLIATNEKGKQTEHEVLFTLIQDDTAPTLTGVADFSVCVNDGISYRSGVEVTDNCDCGVTLDIDSSAVNTAEEGQYPVIYTATDAAGNTAAVTVTVYVYRETVTEQMLYDEIDELIRDKGIADERTKEAQVRKVYSVVRSRLSYVSTSDKSDWVRAAYEGLRTGQGDCFTYFALSKAFFVRLGISSMDIKRTEGIVVERHYWNFVNVGDEEAPRWYHFDACPIRGETHSGCLLTDQQIAAFNRKKVDADGVQNYYYAYDGNAYPASAEKELTETPTLVPYY